MYNLKLAKHYDVTYLLTTSICKNGSFVSNKTPLTLKDVMFYKSTECFYKFYAKTSGEIISIKKTNVLDIREL